MGQRIELEVNGKRDPVSHPPDTPLLYDAASPCSLRRETRSHCRPSWSQWILGIPHPLQSRDERLTRPFFGIAPLRSEIRACAQSNQFLEH